MASPALTDVPGIRVGHAHDEVGLTGCTVILTPTGTLAGVDVRGGGPGTHETDILSPLSHVQEVHAITLCGGSAFGLAAIPGVMLWLREHDIGYQTKMARIPIVPGAVIYDLAIGNAHCWPTLEMGHAACEAAQPYVTEGCVGAGIGALVGKVAGQEFATKSGIGTWSETLPDGTVIGALVVCNAFGDVRRDDHIFAGARHPETGHWADSMAWMRRPETQAAMYRRSAHRSGNTTLVVVATNAVLDKSETTKLAQMAHDGLARVISPIHTPIDGDTVFALSTKQNKAAHQSVIVLGSIAAEVVAEATIRAVNLAVGMGGFPAASDVEALQ